MLMIIKVYDQQYCNVNRNKLWLNVVICQVQTKHFISLYPLYFKPISKYYKLKI